MKTGAARFSICAVILAAAAWAAYSQQSKQTLSTTLTLPSPNGIFNSLVTQGNFSASGGSLSNPTNNTYLNRQGGDTILVYNSGNQPGTAGGSTPSTGHVVIGSPGPNYTNPFIAPGYAPPYALVEVGGAVRVMDPVSVDPTPQTGTGVELYYKGSAGYIQACTRSSGACTMLPLDIASLGNTFIQIGNTSTQVSIDGAAQSGYALTVNGSSYQTDGFSSWASSDARLKDVEGPYQAGLKEILRLNPIRYRFKKGNALNIPSGEEHVGLAGQDVRKVLPDAVRRESDGYLSLNYEPIYWALLNAIKEQHKEIAELRAQLAATEKQP